MPAFNRLEMHDIDQPDIAESRQGRKACLTNVEIGNADIFDHKEAPQRRITGGMIWPLTELGPPQTAPAFRTKPTALHQRDR